MVLAVFLGTMLLLHLIIAWGSRSLISKGYPDFTIFYSAGKIVGSGLGPQLYDESTQYRIQQEFAAGVTTRQGPLPYNHPPFEALLFVPITWFPYAIAFVLWDILNILVLLALLPLLRPYLPLLRRASPMSLLFGSLAFFPVFIALLQGQDILVLVLLLTLTFVSLKRKRDFAAGCWLGFGLFRLHFVLPFVPILLLQKKYKAILGIAAMALVLAVVSAMVVGWRATVDYPGYVLHVEHIMGQRKTALPIGMPNLRGLVDSLPLRRSSATLRNSILAATSLALILFGASRWKMSEAVIFDLGFSLCVIITIVVGYHAFAYDLSLLLVPVLLVMNFCSERDTGMSQWALVGPILILFLTPLQMFLGLHSARYSLVALVLLVWAWGIAREISRQAPPRKHALKIAETTGT